MKVWAYQLSLESWKVTFRISFFSKSIWQWRMLPSVFTGGYGGLWGRCGGYTPSSDVIEVYKIVQQFYQKYWFLSKKKIEEPLYLIKTAECFYSTPKMFLRGWGSPANNFNGCFSHLKCQFVDLIANEKRSFKINEPKTVFDKTWHRPLYIFWWKQNLKTSSNTDCNTLYFLVSFFNLLRCF